MSYLAPSEVALLATIVLVFVGTLVMLALFLAKYFSTSTNASRWLGRSKRASESETKGRVRGACDARDPAEDGSARASDADRGRTVEKLREETTQGRITASEFEERVESAQCAKTLRELDQLVQDSPNGRHQSKSG